MNAVANTLTQSSALFAEADEDSPMSRVVGAWLDLHGLRASHHLASQVLLSELQALTQPHLCHAIVKLIALMFQPILQEERIPAEIRALFARLQTPVLSLALAEPDFSRRQDHPARQLIDRIGSCVLGFDANRPGAQALEAEVRRMVQVVEQFPDATEHLYRHLDEEFQAFLEAQPAFAGRSQTLLGVAQQLEDKDILAIQATIALRNEIKAVPVPDEIRDFLYKVWSEVLALASMQHGQQHAQTLRLQKAGRDLIWATSAKAPRAGLALAPVDRSELLHTLRAGMRLLGWSPQRQDDHLRKLDAALGEAGLPGWPAIDSPSAQALTACLLNLEDALGSDVAEDWPLDAQRLEDWLGMEASGLQVVMLAASPHDPQPAAGVPPLTLGAWFTLDDQGQILQVQYVWRGPQGRLHLFASRAGRSYLIQSGCLVAYLAAGWLAPHTV